MSVEWNLVAIGLPEKDGWYLVTCEPPFDQRAQYHFFDGKRFDVLHEQTVAWREVPAPYAPMSMVHIDCYEGSDAIQSRTQFDNCPGCGSVDKIEMADCGVDDPSFGVFCRPCQWFAYGQTIDEAIENWNKRTQI